jgi:hypothetical protein
MCTAICFQTASSHAVVPPREHTPTTLTNLSYGLLGIFIILPHPLQNSDFAYDTTFWPNPQKKEDAKSTSLEKKESRNPDIEPNPKS